MSDITIYGAKAALSALIARYEADIDRYRLTIAQQAQHAGPQDILSLVYGWHVALGVLTALRQIRDADPAPTRGPLDGQEPLIGET